MFAVELALLECAAGLDCLEQFVDSPATAVALHDFALSCSTWDAAVTASLPMNR